VNIKVGELFLHNMISSIHPTVSEVNTFVSDFKSKLLAFERNDRAETPQSFERNYRQRNRI
jgi:hypothetical protein